MTETEVDLVTQAIKDISFILKEARRDDDRLWGVVRYTAEKVLASLKTSLGEDFKGG